MPSTVPTSTRRASTWHTAGGTLVVAGNDAWPGVGHSAAYALDGRDVLVFHGYEAAADGRPRLWIAPITWDDRDWPTVSLDPSL